MTTAGPWSVKGIDPKARELAKDLARRSGMTLGEWLNQMIIEGDADDEAAAYVPPQPIRNPSREIRLSSDAEMKRIARALDALTARMEAAENRSTLAISGIDQSVMGVLSRIEGVERDRGAVAARFDSELDEVKASQAKVAERLRRLADEDAPKLEAMRALENALGKIAEKLYETDAKTRSALNDVREDVSNMSRRMDRVETRVEAEPATALVDAVVGKLGDRLVEAESRTAAAMKALEVSFAGLDDRLRSFETSHDENSPERRFERLAAELNDKVEANRAEMTERLSAAADGKLDRMETTLRELAGHVEQGERRSAQAIDRMGREVMRIAQTLGDRVSSVEARNAEAAQQMGGEMARIADAMEHRMSRADQVQAEALEKLGGEISRIAERLADRIANSERRTAAAMDDVGEQIGRVSERINERYDATQGAIGERIRASEERTAKLLDEARESIDRRLQEAQRRAALEAAEAARQAAEKAAERTSRTPPPSVDDPFAPISTPKATTAPRPLDEEPRFAAAEEAFVDSQDRFSGFTTDGVEAEAFSAPPKPATAFEPLSTRDVVAAARAAARQASERPEGGRGKRDALARVGITPDLTGSVAAPPLEAEKERGGFSFALPKRKKKEPQITLRTMVAASGTAAVVAMGLAGAQLYMAAEGGHGDHVDRSSPPPTAARQDDKPTLASSTPAEGTGLSDPAADANAKTDTLAVALSPGPGDTPALRTATPTTPAALAAKTKPAAGASPPTGAKPVEARPLYNTAIGRLQAGDASGVEDLRKAANLGFAPAQFYLAKLYEAGGSGIKKDLAEARRWTERAAQAGDARAMHNLALYAFNGEGGPKDQIEATRWFKKAADQGVVDSQYNLGRIYENGMKDPNSGAAAVPQNKAEAYKWYLVAAAQGDQDAKTSAAALKAQLPADQATAAERTAQAFRPQKAATIDTAKAQ